MTIHATFGDAPVALSPPWSSSDTITSSASDVAQVSAGQITFGNVGTAVLTNASRGNQTRTVEVAPASDHITLSAAQTVAFAAGATVPLPTTTDAGLPLTYTTSDAGVAEPTGPGSVVVIRGAGGPITLTATGAGDANHEAQSPATHQLTVTSVTQTLTLGPRGPYAVGATASLPLTSSEGLTVSYASSIPGVASVTGNTLTAVAPGTTVITGTQAGTAGIAEATPVHCTVVVYTWTSQTDGATTLTDVSVDLDDVNLSGSGGGLSAADALADGDTSQKHFRLDVPDYADNGSGNQPRSYVHLGAYPTDGTTLDRGDDMLEAVGLTVNASGAIPDNWFFDDWRDVRVNQKSTTRYRRDDGAGGDLSDTSTTPSTPGLAAGSGIAQSQLTAELVSRGGWREHTDGNRISTTRGDRVDVIGGNYTLVVMGRVWDLKRMYDGVTDPDPTDGWVYSYWECSGGHNRDSTNTEPEELARIAWKDSTWQTITETLKGDTESNYYGVQEEYFRGPSLISRVGSSTPTSEIAHSGADGSEQQTGDKPDWYNPSPGRLQMCPSVTETTQASTVTSHTVVNTTISDSTTVTGTIESKTLAGGASVSISSYTPDELSDADCTAAACSGTMPTNYINKFHERLHCAASISYEQFLTKNEKECGNWSFEVDMPVILSCEFSLAATATLALGDFELTIKHRTFELELFLGLAAELKVGIWGTVNVFDSHGTTIGRSLQITAPLKVEVENLKTETKVVKYDIQAARARADAQASQT